MGNGQWAMGNGQRAMYGRWTVDRQYAMRDARANLRGLENAEMYELDLCVSILGCLSTDLAAPVGDAIRVGWVQTRVTVTVRVGGGVQLHWLHLLHLPKDVFSTRPRSQFSCNRSSLLTSHRAPSQATALLPRVSRLSSLWGSVQPVAAPR